MMLTIFSSTGFEIWGTSALLGCTLLIMLTVAIALSSQRWLLWYLFGGVAYWLTVEVIHAVVFSVLSLSDWHSYVVAMSITWLPLAGWVLYRALRYDDVSDTLHQERLLAAERYVEHSPIYDDNYQPRF